MIRYKVVLPRKGKLVSVGAFGRAERKYSTKRWTMASRKCQKMGYHLLVFSTLSNARRFRSTYAWINRPQLWQCQVEGSVPLEYCKYQVTPSMANKFGLYPEDLKASTDFYVFFEEYLDKTMRELYWKGSWPDGTEMWKKVKLLRKIR